MHRLRRTHLATLLAVVAALGLGAVLSTALGASKAEPTATRHALAQTDRVQGAPRRTLVLSKVAIEPGAVLAPHYHRGSQVARIASGTLTYTVLKGSVVVRKGESDQASKPVRKIKAGQTGRLSKGEWIVEQPSTVHEAVNRGSTPVVVFLATLLETGAPPATPASARSG